MARDVIDAFMTEAGSEVRLIKIEAEDETFWQIEIWADATAYGRKGGLICVSGTSYETEKKATDQFVAMREKRSTLV
jgi:hypothetical protein